MAGGIPDTVGQQCDKQKNTAKHYRHPNSHYCPPYCSPVPHIPGIRRRSDFNSAQAAAGVCPAVEPDRTMARMEVASLLIPPPGTLVVSRSTCFASWIRSLRTSSCSNTRCPDDRIPYTSIPPNMAVPFNRLTDSRVSWELPLVNLVRLSPAPIQTLTQ